MSKKVISILLSAAMLVAVLCVGVGAVLASADDTVTYYFLAPDDYLATNESVGYYYWQPSEIAPWPGAEATPAPEVGKNVYKIECGDMDATGTIIFNAFVDAGSPADPELAKNAHQTVNISVEGYEADENDVYPDGLENFYDMIYVLYNDDDHKSENDLSGAVTTSGEWFSINESDDNYYKNSDAYKTYNFSDDTDTDATDAESTAKYHADDVVTVDVQLGNIDGVSGVNTTVNYDTSVLEYVSATESAMIMVNNNANDGTARVGALFGANGVSDYAGEPATVTTLTFKVTKDTDDLGISYVTTSLSQVVNGENTRIIGKNIDTEDQWTSININVDCPHVTSDTDTDTESESDTITDVEPTDVEPTDVEPTDVEPTDVESSETDSAEPVNTPDVVPGTDTDDTDTATDSEPVNTPDVVPGTTDTDSVNTPDVVPGTTDTDATSDTDTSSTIDTDTSSSDNGSSDKDSEKDSEETKDNANSDSSKNNSSNSSNSGSSSNSNGSAVQTAGTFAVISLIVVLMGAAAVVLRTRKKIED